MKQDQTDTNSRAATERINIVDTAEFVCKPGPLSGEALTRARENRRLRAHFEKQEAFENWKAGHEPEPEIAFWMRDDDP